MPNPAASPAVSSTVGLKNMVIAPLTVDTEETLTYGALQLVAGAIEASITPPDDVLDGYPVDRLMHDIALALMAVQTQTTEILSQFPTKAAKEPTPPQPATEAEEIPLF